MLNRKLPTQCLVYISHYYYNKVNFKEKVKLDVARKVIALRNNLVNLHYTRGCLF